MVIPISAGKNLKNRWYKDHDIKVNGIKTVQDIYSEAEGRTLNAWINYLTAGTCIGAAGRAERALMD